MEHWEDYCRWRWADSSDDTHEDRKLSVSGREEEAVLKVSNQTERKKEGLRKME